ncbi:hypothetical protein HUG20_09050 [Salicibibacter cibi]|uniref:DedA family protein n=1 Tax=Salicibibacter cibi TaxID=2743001 RepID=A0A7T6ZB47_9BACI|nr:hypothetical protein [Salicibibacter cibi]QQK80020.1 hypothetical protein HUG20_09050 [Salicibibacter cibi]
MGMKYWSGVWGWAEATLFFIVPDVLITYGALSNRIRMVVRLCLWALGGALIGGCLMYITGVWFADHTRQLLVMIPAIDDALIEEVREELQTAGWQAIILGPTQGIPYKIYASYAAEADISLLFFLLISVPARVVRFLLAGLLAWGLSQWLLRPIGLRLKIGIWLLFWLTFYSFYFVQMGG